MTHYILILAFLLPNFLVAQLDSIYMLKSRCEYKKAYDILSEIDDTNFTTEEFLYLKLSLESKLGNPQAINTLGDLLQIDSTVKVFNSPDVLPLIEFSQYDSISDIRIGQLEKKGIAYNYPNATKELWKMKVRDQAYYNELSNCVCNDASRSAYIQLKENLNIKNQKALDRIYSEIGWPTIDKVRKSAASSALIVIVHADLEYQKKYINELDKLALEDQISKSDYAVLVDKKMIKEEGLQLYGTQIKLNEEQKFDYSTLKDRVNLDSLRKSMDLPSHDFYLKILKVNK